MKNSKKIAVILSGSGVYDGSEIHEATMTLYAIMKNGAYYHIFAPDTKQYHVINHITGQDMNETRNVLVESARIARGKILPLDKLNIADFDALIFPGGYGVPKNLSDFAFKGAACSVLPEIETIIRGMVTAGKPIGALCIAPVLLARVLGNVELTIGDDKETIDELIQLGATHIETGHGEIVVDKKYKIVTTPCYMLDASIVQIADGVDKVVKTILEMI